MRNFTVSKPDSHKISCVEQIPDGLKGIVIAVHGFTSSKESPTVQMLLRRLPAAGRRWPWAPGQGHQGICG